MVMRLSWMGETRGKGFERLKGRARFRSLSSHAHHPFAPASCFRSSKTPSHSSRINAWARKLSAFRGRREDEKEASELTIFSSLLLSRPFMLGLLFKDLSDLLAAAHHGQRTLPF